MLLAQQGWMLFVLAVIGSLAEELWHLRAAWASRQETPPPFDQALSV